MPNEFYVQPADIQPGLNAAMSGLQAYGAAKSQQASSEAEQQKLDAFVETIKSGDTEAVREMALKNPELATRVQGADEARAAIVKQRRADMAIEGLMGMKPLSQAAIEYTEKAQADGADTTEGLALSELTMQDPEKAKTAFEMALALNGTPDQWKQYQEFKQSGIPEQPDTKAPTDLGNYVKWEEDKWLKANPDKTLADMPPELKQEAFLKAKRAQAGEVGATSAARTEAAEKEKKYSTLVNRAVSAAESVPILKRSLTLLEDLETGGVDAVSQRAKNLFGVESADEGELSNLMGKAVLSQLKETFGAQFTVEEGNRLARLEAGFGKSPEANKRIITQVLAMAKRTVNRARKQALARKDMDQVEELDNLMEFSLNPKEPLPEGVTEDDIQTTMQIHGVTREQVLSRLSGGQ